MPTEWERGYGAGYSDALRYSSGLTGREDERIAAAKVKRPRKVSAYHRRLGVILKRLKKKHTLKSGKWRKGWSQRRLMKAAHKEAKK